MKGVTDEYISADSRIKILVVDDREDNLFSIETILERDGYNITKANSGRAALKILLKEHDFTLILMDVVMPDLNGFETATLIYERDILKHIPIIFITANDSDEDNIFKGYQMGGVDYIRKPINQELLRAKVSVFAELYKKNHQLIDQEQKLMAANRRLEKEIRERKISESKVIDLNIQLLENIKQLQTTNEELERFAYVASHDLQEPLRKIILFTDRLGAKYKGHFADDDWNFIDRILKASERMQTLIKNILTFSRATSATDAFEDTDLNMLIDGVLSDLEISIEQTGASIRVEPLPIISIMPEQFRQLFQNLIINALKFTRENTPPEIHIYSETVKGFQISGIDETLFNNDFCNIHVSDNGIGFEPKYSNEIFTLFKRLHSKDQFEGTGIGLSICKKIVEKHNGFITAKSEVGQGTTFTISVPSNLTASVPDIEQQLVGERKNL
ncbi:MAG: response regulator [Bacteroidetes bacterium]|nr:response regulator [Bacteroidota bacterium]